MSYPRLALLSGWGIDQRIWQLLEGSWPSEIDARPVEWPGYADMPALPTDPTLAQLAASMANSLPSDAVWVGWSLGGLLATALLDYLPPPRGLILLGAGATFCSDEGVSHAQLASFQRAFRRDPEATWRHFLRWQAQGEPDPRKAYQRLAELLGESPSADHETLSQGLDWLATLNNQACLAAASCPIVTLIGEHDPLMSPDQRRAGERLKGVGHCPMLSQPHALTAEISRHAAKMTNARVEVV
ncbi:alpha/beta fold hydrolase [Halovibrio sp. HP20-50]|uniref:alpha/beta fold hydrolase n=1 Tax=Halovibrio sp. HP20-59 TaxID=3080275 RepID=UPI00294B34D6|nr:alpha/beta fold hydrolase [Halovibrio sp. HP20-59]MEA2118710.1 alpha/beta fold hydrolase [Halovibrio sp. HP20-59]